MRRLSIRARLTLWYGVVLFIVLVFASMLVVTVHARLERDRLDEELAAALHTVSGVMRNEIDERLALKEAAGDMLDELNLPGISVGILDESGVLLAATPAVPRPTDGQLRDATLPVVVDLGGDRVRVRSAPAHHHAFAFHVAAWTSMQGVEREDRTLRDALLLGVPIALLLAGVGGWLIATRSLQPLAAMARQADAIDQGLQGARLAVPNPGDELGSVAKAFNALLDRVGGSLRAQRAFMADASHQLRTPVSVVRTAAQVTLSRTARSDEEYRDSLEIVSRQAERLSKMVDDMFMLAMVDAEGRPLQRAPLYLNEIVDGVARDAAPLAIERGLAIAAAADDDVPFTGDEHLLRQMIWNLVDNALRHAPAGTTIALALERQPGQVHILVTDAGSGVGLADRERVFDRFVRLEGSGGTAGAGLGLPIARWIAQAHGGQLAIDDIGHGCRFRITLPLAD